jgi:phosphate ABC transporter phosphate-binding protein
MAGLPVLGLVAAVPLAGLAVVAPPLTAPAAATGPTITGSGSSYAAIAINQWVAEVQQLYGDNVNYSTSSSVIGMNEFAQGQVTFGASEIGYSTGQADYTPPSSVAYQYLPDVAGATCLMYNVNGPAGKVSDLRLDPATVLGIFTGTITSWDDPAITALNPGADLPSTPIITVYRSDASGENYILSDYLDTLFPTTWNKYTTTLDTPSGPQAIWPTPAGGSGSTAPYDFTNWVSQSGSDNASNYVASSNNSITYVETGYAKEHGEPCASLENSSGDYVQPTSLADAIALESDELAPDLEQTLTGVFTSPQAAAYPISAYSYLITEEGSVPAAKGAVLGRFVKFLACQGQEAAGQLGYSPLPPNLVQDDFNAIARIDGAASPGTVNAANCKNPYVDGQTPLPGEPVVQGSSGGSGTTTPASGASTATTGSGPGGAATGGNGTGSGSPGGSAGSSGSTGSSPTAGSTPSGKASGRGLAGAPVGSGASSATTVAGGVQPLSPAVQKELATQQAQQAAASELEPNNVLSVVDRIGGHGPPVVVWWALGFLALFVGPPVALGLRRRRRSKEAA